MNRREQHRTHTKSIHPTRPGRRYRAAVRCVQCDCHIEYLTEAELKEWLSVNKNVSQ